MRYLKFIAAVVGAILMTLSSAVTDGHVDKYEWVQVAIAVTTAIGVWMVANLPSFTYGKTLIAAVLVLLNGIVADLTSGISASEWLNLAIAVLTALGVMVVPNRPAVTTTGTAR